MVDLITISRDDVNELVSLLLSIYKDKININKSEMYDLNRLWVVDVHVTVYEYNIEDILSNLNKIVNEINPLYITSMHLEF